VYGRDYFDKLRSTGFTVTALNYTATLTDLEIERYRLAKGEILPIVSR
jgi:hypothetical protein